MQWGLWKLYNIPLFNQSFGDLYYNIYGARYFLLVYGPSVEHQGPKLNFSFKSARIFACDFQFSSKTSSYIFLAGLHFVSEKNKTDLSDFFGWILFLQKGKKGKKILLFQTQWKFKDHKWKFTCSSLLCSLCMHRYSWRKKYHPKKSLRSVLHQAIQLTVLLHDTEMSQSEWYELSIGWSFHVTP